MQIIPAIDVLDGRVVRLHRGDFGDVTEYGGDPAAAANTWHLQGAGLVHVVDLSGARDGHADPNLARSLSSAGVCFQIGGGLRTTDGVVAALDAGAQRAVLGSVAVWDPDLLATIVTEVGPERLVVALDVRAGRASGAGWLDEGRALAEVVSDVAAAGVVRALVTGVSRDGTMDGPDLDLLEGVADQAPALRLIASGGVGSLADLSTLAATGVEAAIVGKALYEQRFTLREAIEAAG